MKVEVSFRNLPGSSAALGRAGDHTIVADRPHGKAGGEGLSFNGAQLLALALGGCFCNDMQYVAADLGVEIIELAADVTLELGGEPLVATSASLTVRCSLLDGTDPTNVVERAKEGCVVGNTLRQGMSVEISAGA